MGLSLILLSNWNHPFYISRQSILNQTSAVESTNKRSLLSTLAHFCSSSLTEAGKKCHISWRNTIDLTRARAIIREERQREKNRIASDKSKSPARRPKIDPMKNCSPRWREKEREGEGAPSDRVKFIFGNEIFLVALFAEHERLLAGLEPIFGAAEAPVKKRQIPDQVFFWFCSIVRSLPFSWILLCAQKPKRASSADDASEQFSVVGLLL